MELKITKEKDMGLLSRKRLTFSVSGTGATPSRQSLVAEIAKKTKVPEDQVVVLHIYPQFGSTDPKVIAHIYQDKKKLEMFEGACVIKKHQPKAEKKE